VPYFYRLAYPRCVASKAKRHPWCTVIIRRIQVYSCVERGFFISFITAVALTLKLRTCNNERLDINNYLLNVLRKIWNRKLGLKWEKKVSQSERPKLLVRRFSSFNKSAPTRIWGNDPRWNVSCSYIRMSDSREKKKNENLQTACELKIISTSKECYLKLTSNSWAK